MGKHFDTPTPSRLAHIALDSAVAVRPESDLPMHRYEQRSHARRLLLQALRNLEPEYAEALDALTDFESTTDNGDCASACMEAAGFFHTLCTEYEAHAEVAAAFCEVKRHEREEIAFLKVT